MNKKAMVMISAMAVAGAFGMAVFATPSSTSEQAKPVAAQSQAVTGKPAPAFTLADSKGKKHSLSDYQGKFVVLEWVNYGCPFVKKHYESQNMQKLQKNYAAKGVIWLSVNSSAPGKQGHLAPDEINQALKEKSAYPTAYLLDLDGSVGRAYGAKTTPHMFVIDKKGVLVYSGAIDDKVSTDVSDVAGAKNFVSSALDEALAGKPISVASTKSYGCSVKY
jgi:peroxiredoxin